MDRSVKVIDLRLERLADMFETPQFDAFSNHPSFESGIDQCIGELRHRPTKVPVRLEVRLPITEVDQGTAGRLGRALRCYCDQRMTTNERARRTTRLDGLSALKIGLPVALVGLSIAVATTFAHPSDDATFPNTAGWVLAWVGLWYPLDAMLFAHVSPNRENAVLRRLREAEVLVETESGGEGA
jgi:hypothetical protein